jgi:hypothetical protein
MAAMRGTKLSLKRVSLAAACAGLFVGMALTVIRLGG